MSNSLKNKETNGISDYNHSDRNERKIFRIFAIFCSTLCLIVGTSCFWFYGKINETIKDESSSYLQEISSRIESSINQSINDTYLMLHATDSMLSGNETLTFDSFRNVSHYQRQYWDFDKLLLIDENGNAYDENGYSIFLSGGSYLQETILNKEEVMSPSQIVDGKEVSIFVVPLKNKKVNDIEMIAIAATFDTNKIAQFLSLTSFNDQAYSQIVSKDGTMIITSSDTNSNFGYNILSSISESLSKEKIEQIKNDFKSNIKGQSTITVNNVKQEMVYYPIEDSNWILLTLVPSQVINAKSNILLMITLIITGFIFIAFTFLVIALIVTFNRYQKRLERIAFVDEITGGHTIDKFYELASNTLSKNQKDHFAIIYVNLEKFKILNDKFGRKTGDEILRLLYRLVTNELSTNEYMARISADNYCIFLQYTNADEILNRIEAWYEIATKYVSENKTVWALPTGQFGIYYIGNDDLSFPQMIDRAKLSLKENSQSINSKVHYGIYNEKVRSLLIREKQLEDMMDFALKNNEFRMYLQPKYSVKTECIIGAEALARWQSENEGMIYPNEFIPLFEKNGFIVQLDIWMFEQLCKLLRSWIDKGKKSIKISINCSRVHLRNKNFLNPYIQLKEKYNIPDYLIEIELTENIVIEDAERFKDVVNEIHKAGFGCSMDDFGSGYSSLNMIQEISVDTLKIDKVFFSKERRDSNRTESVVSNIIGMAQALSMKTVAEGVEYPEQITMLKRVGCNIIQGYVYARPMTIEDFEKLWDVENQGDIQNEETD